MFAKCAQFGSPMLWPSPICDLPSLTPETVRAMTHVINQGMAMYWGTSRWSSMEIMVGAGQGVTGGSCAFEPTDQAPGSRLRGWQGLRMWEHLWTGGLTSQ